jgi:hypothetical protein
MIDRETAAVEFTDRVRRKAYENVIQHIVKELREGLAMPRAPEDMLKRMRWFGNLKPEDLRMVTEIIDRAAFSSAFEVMVVLDNLTGGYPIRGTISEFALYLQVFDDLESKKVDQPRERVKISPALGRGEDLHELFQVASKNKGFHGHQDDTAEPSGDGAGEDAE